MGLILAVLLIPLLFALVAASAVIKVAAFVLRLLFAPALALRRR